MDYPNYPKVGEVWQLKPNDVDSEMPEYQKVVIKRVFWFYNHTRVEVVNMQGVYDETFLKNFLHKFELAK